jgi:hypothetical protein
MIMTDGIVPRTPVQAISRLASFVDVAMPYRLGAGGYHGIDSDSPWSADNSGVVGCDCWGAIRFAYALSAHRPGFNKFAYARFDILDVEDDVNSNSAIGDARHRQELFVELTKGTTIQMGDIVTYPTIMLTHTVATQIGSIRSKTDWLRNPDGSIKQWIGHGALVRTPNGAVVGDHFSKLSIIQCYGPNNRRPAIRVTDGSVFDHHDATWPEAQHRTTVLRVKT